jgi:hypothetical protein
MAACSSSKTSGPPDPSGGAGGSGGSGGAGGSAPGPRQATALHACGDGTMLVTAHAIARIASDSQNVYWLGSEDADWVVKARAKSGGAIRTVAAVQHYYPGLSDPQTTSAASMDAPFGFDDLLADDRDDFVYFSGATKIWRAKKDGSEPVQPVSTNAVGGGHCNAQPDRLTSKELFVCRRNEIFHMPRGTAVDAKSLYKAPSGSSIEAFAADDTNVYTSGPFDKDRHFAPLVKIAIATGTPTEHGQMLEGLVPDAIFIVGQSVVFDSLVDTTGAPTLELANEWAKRQGSYRIGLTEQRPTKISDEQIELIRGASADATHVYAMVGDQMVVRIPAAGGSTQTVVDCNKNVPGGDSDVRFHDLFVDADALYVIRSDRAEDDHIWSYKK